METCFQKSFKPLSSSINILKSGATFKVLFATEDDEICSVKINIYKSGSVVKQGPKCSVFKDLFFQRSQTKSRQ